MPDKSCEIKFRRTHYALTKKNEQVFMPDHKNWKETRNQVWTGLHCEVHEEEGKELRLRVDRLMKKQDFDELITYHKLAVSYLQRTAPELYQIIYPWIIVWDKIIESSVTGKELDW